MRWYQFQLHKPKRWSRRAKSDGSAVPKLKRVMTRHMSWVHRYAIWMTMFFVLLAVFAFIAMQIYLWIAQHWIHQLFPSLFTQRIAFTVVISAISLTLSMNIWFMVFAILNSRVRARIAKLAVAHRCHLCPRCGYSLHSRTSDDQPCSECGQRISRREAVRLWARFCR